MNSVRNLIVSLACAAGLPAVSHAEYNQPIEHLLTIAEGASYEVDGSTLYITKSKGGAHGHCKLDKVTTLNDRAGHPMRLYMFHQCENKAGSMGTQAVSIVRQQLDTGWLTLLSQGLESLGVPARCELQAAIVNDQNYKVNVDDVSGTNCL